LDIVRTQSTDMMREIIRCYLVPHVAPTLGYSSFDAWRGLPQVEGSAASAQDPVIAGFLAQFGTVRVALEATIVRAVKERTDLIVDGVHVMPTYLGPGGVADQVRAGASGVGGDDAQAIGRAVQTPQPRGPGS
jgi:2-phosphoglycerate kinase